MANDKNIVKSKEEEKKRVKLIDGELLKKICTELTEVLEKYKLSDGEISYIVTFLYEGIKYLDEDVRKQAIVSSKLQLIKKKIMEEVKKKDL